MPLLTQRRQARALGLTLALAGVGAGVGFSLTAPRPVHDTAVDRTARTAEAPRGPVHPLPELPTDDGPRILGIEYGMSNYPAAAALSDPGHRTVVAFTWMFYLVLTDERRILIDTGFVDRAYVARYGIRHYRAPDQLLDQLGFPPATITDVVLTHGHFDHAGGIVRYPEATLYLQRATAKHIGQDANLGAARRHLVQAEKEGRLHWVGQSYHLTDELVIQHVGGHTQGSQVVVLSHDDRRYLFVGDECYLREACLAGQPLPPRVATNGVRNQAFVERMAKEAQTGRGVLLTFHDPVILSEHPALAPGVVQIR